MSWVNTGRCVVLVICVAFALALSAAAEAAIPDRLYVIDESQMTEEESLMVQSLQGIVARNAPDDEPQIWISGNIDPATLDYITHAYGIATTSESDPWRLVDRFEGYLQGYVRCDIGLRSMNVAAPAAAVFSGVVAGSSVVANTLGASPYNLSPLIDARGVDESYLLGWPWDDLNHGLLIELSVLPPGRRHLRDLAASEVAIPYWYVGGMEALRADAMAATTDHSRVIGWTGDNDERTWIRTASYYQHPAVRAESCHNLSVLSRLGSGNTYNQKATSHSGRAVTSDGVHYVCIVMVGGWDIGWTLNRFGGSNWFGSRHRGDFPMNWEISPALLRFAPPGLGYFYSLAMPDDFFVSAASGYGMLYVDKYPGLATYASILGPMVKQTDLRIVNVVGDENLSLSYAAPYLDQPEVLGVFYRTYDNYYTGIPAGQYATRNGKVIWPYRYSLWNNGQPGHAATEIADAIQNDPHRSPTSDPLSYSLVAIYPNDPAGTWPDGSTVMDQVAVMVDRLAATTRVRLVSAEEFMFHLRRNFGDGWSGPSFPDVTTTHWAWEWVEGIYSASIVQGYPDGSYHPQDVVARDQMAAFLARALAGGEANVPNPTCTEPPFPDVACDSWARKYIAYCKNAGIVGGYEDGLYHPERPVARDQLAVFIARALAGSDSAVPDLECTTPPFPDVPCNFWARRHIVYCKDRGIVAGYPDGFYYPGVLVSRDQMAVFVSRAFGLVD